MKRKVKKELKEKMLDIREFCKENKIEYLSACVMLDDNYINISTRKENIYKFGSEKWNETSLEKR